MRNSLLPLIAGACLTLAGLAQTSENRHDVPQMNSCIKEFYDPEMYNYLTFKNVCAESLTVVLIAKDGSGAGGTMELRPGGKDWVGRPKGNAKEPKPGSFALYVCQSGYLPMDDNHRLVSKPGSNFSCQLKAQ